MTEFDKLLAQQEQKLGKKMQDCLESSDGVARIVDTMCDHLKESMWLARQLTIIEKHGFKTLPHER